MGKHAVRRRDCKPGAIQQICPSRSCHHGAKCAYAWHRDSQPRAIGAPPGRPLQSQKLGAPRPLQAQQRAVPRPRPSKGPAWRVLSPDHRGAQPDVPLPYEDEDSMEYGEDLLWLAPGAGSERQDDLGGSSSGLSLAAAPCATPTSMESQEVAPFLTEGTDGIGVEGARLPRGVCQQLGILTALDMQLALSALEEYFHLWMHPGFVSAWHSDRVLAAELQGLSITHADDVWRYRRACIGIRTQTLAFSGMDGSWKPLQAALSQVAGQGSCLRLQPPRAVAREAIQWLGPLLPLLSVQLAAEWSRGQWLIRQHTAVEVTPTPFESLLGSRWRPEASSGRAGYTEKGKPDAGRRRPLWGSKQRTRRRR